MLRGDGSGGCLAGIQASGFVVLVVVIIVDGVLHGHLLKDRVAAQGAVVVHAPGDDLVVGSQSEAVHSAGSHFDNLEVGKGRVQARTLDILGFARGTQAKLSGAALAKDEDVERVGVARLVDDGLLLALRRPVCAPRQSGFFGALGSRRCDTRTARLAFRGRFGGRNSSGLGGLSVPTATRAWARQFLLLRASKTRTCSRFHVAGWRRRRRRVVGTLVGSFDGCGSDALGARVCSSFLDWFLGGRLGGLGGLSRSLSRCSSGGSGLDGCGRLCVGSRGICHACALAGRHGTRQTRVLLDGERRTEAQSTEEAMDLGRDAWRGCRVGGGKGRGRVKPLFM